MEFISLVAAITSFFLSILTKLLADRKKEDEQPKTIEKQLSNLNKVSKSLSELQDFINEQKESLAENEKTLNQLRKQSLLLKARKKL